MLKGIRYFLNKTRPQSQAPEPPPQADPITGVLMDDLVYLRAKFGGSADLTIRRLNVCGRKAAILSIEGMVDRHMMANAVILPIMEIEGVYAPEGLLDHIRDEVLGFTDILQVSTMQELIELISSGFGAVLVDGAWALFTAFEW